MENIWFLQSLINLIRKLVNEERKQDIIETLDILDIIIELEGIYVEQLDEIKDTICVKPTCPELCDILDWRDEDNYNGN